MHSTNYLSFIIRGFFSFRDNAENLFWKKRACGVFKQRSKKCGTRNCKEPCPHDASCNSPPHGRQSLYRSHPHNSSRNRMRGAKGDAKERQEYDSYAASCLGTKTAYRMQFRQTHSERFYYSPAAKVRTQSYSRMARENHP